MPKLQLHHFSRGVWVQQPHKGGQAWVLRSWLWQILLWASKKKRYFFLFCFFFFFFFFCNNRVKGAVPPYFQRLCCTQTCLKIDWNTKQVYSQLSPCGHLAITDTPLIRTAAKSPAKVTDVWLKQTPALTDSRYYGVTDTLFSPDDTILLFWLSL